MKLIEASTEVEKLLDNKLLNTSVKNVNVMFRQREIF